MNRTPAPNRIDFADGQSAEISGAPPFDVSFALPAAVYPFAPVVLPAAEGAPLLRLATVSDAGEVAAWPVAEGVPTQPVWRHDAASPPLSAPLVWFDPQAKRTKVLVLTAGGVLVLDAADGRLMARLAWSLSPERTAVAALREGRRADARRHLRGAWLFPERAVAWAVLCAAAWAPAGVLARGRRSRTLTRGVAAPLGRGRRVRLAADAAAGRPS